MFRSSLFSNDNAPVFGASFRPNLLGLAPPNPILKTRFDGLPVEIMVNIMRHCCTYHDHQSLRKACTIAEKASSYPGLNKYWAHYILIEEFRNNICKPPPAQKSLPNGFSVVRLELDETLQASLMELRQKVFGKRFLEAEEVREIMEARDRIYRELSYLDFRNTDTLSIKFRDVQKDLVTCFFCMEDWENDAAGVHGWIALWKTDLPDDLTKIMNNRHWFRSKI